MLTEWDETKCPTKCWQRNMSQYSLLYVIIFCHHPVETFSVWEVRGRFFALDGISHNWAQVFQCKCQVWDYITLLMQTLHQGQCWVYTEAGSGRGDLVCKGECLFTRLHDYCITPVLRWKSVVNDFISKHVLLQWRAKCVRVTICQHRSTVVWVDCAKMTCCIGFFSFLFSKYIQDAV